MSIANDEKLSRSAWIILIYYIVMIIAVGVVSYSKGYSGADILMNCFVIYIMGAFAVPIVNNMR